MPQAKRRTRTVKLMLPPEVWTWVLTQDVPLDVAVGAAVERAWRHAGLALNARQARARRSLDRLIRRRAAMGGPTHLALDARIERRAEALVARLIDLYCHHGQVPAEAERSARTEVQRILSGD